MNRKAQAGPVSFIFSMLFFLIFVGVIGGSLWALFGLAAESAGLTGLEAFVFNNFAMVVAISSILGTMAFFYFGGR